eukprot:300533-Pleurochrysis_carterae.AAC.1
MLIFVSSCDIVDFLFQLFARGEWPSLQAAKEAAGHAPPTAAADSSGGGGAGGAGGACGGEGWSHGSNGVGAAGGKAGGGRAGAASALGRRRGEVRPEMEWALKLL